jgi:hypothetical protein
MAHSTESALTLLAQLGHVSIETVYDSGAASPVIVGVKGCRSRDIALSKAFKAARDISGNWQRDPNYPRAKVFSLKPELAAQFDGHSLPLAATAPTLAEAVRKAFELATSAGRVVERTWESASQGAWGDSSENYTRDFVKLDEKSGVWIKTAAPELL